MNPTTLQRAARLLLALALLPAVLPGARAQAVSAAAPAPAQPASTMEPGLTREQDALIDAVVANSVPRVRKLLADGVDPNFVTPQADSSPLMLAAFRRMHAVATALLDGKADPNLVSPRSRRTALTHARDVPMLALLHARGSRLEPPQGGTSAFANALRDADLARLAWLREHGADMNRRIGGEHPMTWLVNGKRCDLVEPLAKLGTDPGGDQSMALYVAIDENRPDCARALVAAGADVNQWPPSRYPLLQTAVFRGQVETVELLLKAGANGHVQPPPGCKHMLCKPGELSAYAARNPDMLALLRRHGMQPGADALAGLMAMPDHAIAVARPGRMAGVAVNARTGSATAVAAAPAKPAIAIPAPDKELLADRLIAAGAPVNGDGSGATPLMMALQRPPRELALKLVAAGGRIDAAVTLDDGNATLAYFAHNGMLNGMRMGPLGYALAYGRADVAAALAERDRKVGRDDAAAAYFAARRGEWDAVPALLAAGADANAADRAGITPLMMAARAGRTDMVKLLLRHGAQADKRSARSWPPLFSGRGPGHNQPDMVGGHTAAELAKQSGHRETAAALRAQGK